MRRILVVGLFILRLFDLLGGPVDQKGIIPVVNSFITSNFPNSITYSIKEVTPVQSAGQITFYIVNLKPEGWLLISGEDKVEPILGYNFTGFFNMDYQTINTVKHWIDGYNNTIIVAARNKTLERHKLWDGNVKLKSADVVTIEPFIAVTWDQGSSWNRFCPADVNGPGGHAYVGCVAVCMAQAMSVYKFPVSPIGSKTYVENDYGTITVHFDNEEPFKWDSMGLDAADIHNTRLLYDCAVSVAMNFGADGSGSFTSRVPAALKTYFKYYNGVKRVLRVSSDSAWIQLLVDELKAGRPVIYSGDADNNEAGHAFNIDGVISSKFFHLNWGWSGSFNGYFVINDLSPGTHDFTKNHEAVINIRPPVYCPTDLDITKKSVREGLPAGTFIGKLKITDEAVDNKYTVTLLGDSVDKDVYLPPDVYFSNDSLMTLNEFKYSEKSAYTLYIKVIDIFDHVYQEKFIISVIENTALSEPNETSANNIIVYPNPSDGRFTIQFPEHDDYVLELFDYKGDLVLRKYYSDYEPFRQVDIPVPGIYLLRITAASGTMITRKVLVK